MAHRRTLRQSFSLRAEGVRSGRQIGVTVEPAAEGTGLVLTATEPNLSWPLDLAHTLALLGCTAAGTPEYHVAYIEHFLAACAGVGLTDARLVVEGPELPLLDGSAKPWLHRFLAAGLEDYPGLVQPLLVTETVIVTGNQCALLAFPAPEAALLYLLEHPHRLIGTQAAGYRPATEDFARLARARTFTTVEEAEYARAQGWLKSGSEENALIVYPDHLSADPGYPEAFASHKLLDLVGDLYLLGRPLQAKIAGFNSGHRLNREFAQALAKHAEVGRQVPTP